MQLVSNKDSVLDIGESVKRSVEILTYVNLLPYMYFICKYGIGFDLFFAIGILRNRRSEQ